jgi:carbonic anhydrase
MRKLIHGIVEFRRNHLPGYREKFARLALRQNPDALFITCSDSRVAPNWFASTDPGDLFVVRNVGNLIPSCGKDAYSTADESEWAAIEFAILNLKVSDIIVCGHSDCGAMHALLGGRDKIEAPHLRSWLRHGEPSLAKLPPGKGSLSRVNQLSQRNVLEQLENLKSSTVVSERLAAGRLKLHGWWFDVATADVYSYSESESRFLLIDSDEPR